MTILNIRKVDDKVLKEKAAPVSKFDHETKQLLDDMAQTMYNAKGVGLAAPQVGYSLRMIIVDIGEGLIELINPVVLAAEGCTCDMEGCLSFPGLCGEVERYAEVTVEGYNREGGKVIIKGKDFLARVLQHEIDHLEGILFIERTKKVSKG